MARLPKSNWEGLFRQCCSKLRCSSIGIMSSSLASTSVGILWGSNGTSLQGWEGGFRAYIKQRNQPICCSIMAHYKHTKSAIVPEHDR